MKKAIPLTIIGFSLLGMWLGTTVRAALQTPTEGWSTYYNSERISSNVSNPDMAAALVSAIADFDNNTVLSVCIGSCGGNRTLVFMWFMSLGSTVGWAGEAHPQNAAGQWCYESSIYPPTPSNGGCLEKDVVNGFAVINRDNPLTINEPGYLLRHEMAHVFGLKHPECSVPGQSLYSVMQVGCGSSRASVLTIADRNAINNLYD